jgi:serine protease Do
MDRRSRWNLAACLALILIASGAAPLAGRGLVQAAAPAAPQPAATPQAKPRVSSPASLADLKSLEDKIRKVVERVRPAVVQVSGGSGVVVSQDGLVMTVAHVGGRAGRSVTITFPDSRKARGVTLGNDRTGDAGLMKITDPGPWPYVDVAKSAEVELGQWCVAVSYPVNFGHSRQPTVRLGRVHHRCPLDLGTDCTIMGGDSGGPLFDLEGRVIGISTRCGDSVRENAHVATDRFRANWERLVKGEDIDDRAGQRRALLGIGLDRDAEDARIGSITPDGAAAKAGLKAGDVILRFACQEIQSYAQLPPLVQKHKPGDLVALQVRRGNEVLQLQVTLGEPRRSSPPPSRGRKPRT